MESSQQSREWLASFSWNMLVRESGKQKEKSPEMKWNDGVYASFVHIV